MPRLPRVTWKRAAAACLLAVLSLYTAMVGYRVVRWKTYIWLPYYLTHSNAERVPPGAERHVIFTMVDHYEPGKGEAGAEVNRRWLAHFKPIADRHDDSFGNNFRYTWFYPYDHHNEEVLRDLCAAARQGYGEVELHWHVPPGLSHEEYLRRLDEAVAWFQRHGAMISSGPEPKTAFAYIAGNWDLDGSRPNGHGLTRQLDALRSRGCYADFTFSTIGTPCQPRKVNSIYYAADTLEPKSYDSGIDVQVGRPVDDRLMIVQGPVGINWWNGGLEYGAVESYARPTPKRIERWIDTNIHVRGRPEWGFVKVYSHGIQSRRAIVEADLERMLAWLEEICGRRGLALHYMTAREMYNVIKAAEAGRQGNPEAYRDWRIPPPLNAVVGPQQ
ncbi:MAG: hypothetical protein ACUVX9_18865, partial [Anaerolineae bacterium]